MHAYITKKWEHQWVYNNSIKLLDNVIDELCDIKNSLKTDFIDSGNYFTISYEELYYNDGFQKIVDYLNIDNVKNQNFPHGEKYRIDILKNIT